MLALSRHGARIAVSLIPLLLAVLHALGVLQLGLLDRLDHILYDARLRATLSATRDERVVIVDIDERSLAEVGRWPWSRDRLALLVEQLFDQQGVALLGLDTVFAEADDSARPDADLRFARALQGRPVVLGYYFTSDRQGHISGVLPDPVLRAEDLQGRPLHATRWTGYGSNIAPLAAAAPQAGFFNALADGDGVVRSLPLLAEHQGAFYESLALAMFRRLQGQPRLEPGYGGVLPLLGAHALPSHLRLLHGANAVELPVDERMAMLVPFRGPGGPQGGSYTYVSAADVLAGRLPPGQLRERIVLLGTTVPGLMDLRVTPVGEAYPGVETHANLLSGLLDGRPLVRPDYAPGYELLTLLVSGLVLAVGLPLLSATRAVLLSLGVVAVLVGLNFWLYLGHGLVLPLAASLVTAGLSFALNMSYGYLVESRAKRELAQLFGTYVPPELVQQMLRDPERYSMAATTREMTVLFCDLKGFTTLAEHMEPTQVQALLNTVFSRLTQVIRRHGGTVDKYMGDCVMAFWGAPMECPDHARRAVDAAQDMLTAIRILNAEHARQGLPAIGAGVGISTGPMCVGDMGSDLRRSYTVVGDAVNLGARLESLSRVYGEDIVVSEATQVACHHLAWQELDRVQVKGKADAVTVFTPVGPIESLERSRQRELDLWHDTLRRWRERDWDGCQQQLEQLQALSEEKVLYRLYIQRVASMRCSTVGPGPDGVASFDVK